MSNLSKNRQPNEDAVLCDFWEDGSIKMATVLAAWSSTQQSVQRRGKATACDSKDAQQCTHRSPSGASSNHITLRQWVPY